MTRILHLSDPHFGAVDLDIARKFVARAGELAPDLTILSGDLTMRARRSELADAKQFVEQLPQPRLVIPGNHDIPHFNRLERFLNPFRRFRETFGDDLEPEWITDGIHVVSLNSSRGCGPYLDWSEGRLSKTQLAGVIRKFETGPPGALRILVLHHPLLELQLAGRAVVKPLGPLMQVLETARVDLVMCGHFHRSQLHAAGLTDQWRSLISQAPTVCSTRLQGEPQGFHEFHISGDRIDAIHHSFEQGDFQPIQTGSYHRTAKGWSAAPAESSQ